MADECPELLSSKCPTCGDEHLHWEKCTGKKPEAAVSDELLATINAVDVVFVMDTTGSMGSWIHEARRQARVAAENVAATGLDLRFHVIEYRDHPPQELSFVTNTHHCATSDELQAALDSLTPTGGGDEAEAVLDGLAAACCGNLWRDKSDRRLFLIGDSPPHGCGGSDGFPQGCPCGATIEAVAAQLREMNIQLHAISVAGNPTTTAAFRRLATLAGGECVEAQVPQRMSESYTGTMVHTAGLVGTLRSVNAKFCADGGTGSATVGWSAEKIAAEEGITLTAANALKDYAKARGIDPADAKPADGKDKDK